MLVRGTEMDKINLAHKFSLFSDQYNPKIVGELNDFYVKLVKLQGPFVWHHHATRSRALSLGRRGDIHHAVGAQVYAQHRQREERAHSTRTAAAVKLIASPISYECSW